MPRKKKEGRERNASGKRSALLRGVSSKRLIVDETAPIYHVGTAAEYPPMHFVVSDEDIECRYEQTMLMLAAMKSF